MEKAIQLSHDNIKNHHGGPFGAVIIKNNEIVSEGVNSVVQNNDPTAHAEVMAIRKACIALDTIDLSDCIICSSCEPCPMCFAAIRWARINKIYYANTRLDAEKIGFNDNNIYQEIYNVHAGIPIDPIEYVHFPDERALTVFEEWCQDDMNISY